MQLARRAAIVWGQLGGMSRTAYARPPPRESNALAVGRVRRLLRLCKHRLVWLVLADRILFRDLDEEETL
jgi:hypothetical protein